MKRIEKPPDWFKVLENRKSFFELLNKPETTSFINHINDRYLYWDELRYQKLPEAWNHELAWALVKLTRISQMRSINLLSMEKKPFGFSLPDNILRELHFIDQNATGQILADEPMPTGADKDRYIISALMEEAIASSILEGAATTRKKAKEMLRDGKTPKTRGELMIKNNYFTMVKIKERINEKLSIELLCEIQALITKNTLDESTASGRLRNMHEDDIRVIDNTDGTILHIPPPAAELKERLQKLCDFANESSPGTFMHPVIKGTILHFWLAYEHPFVDGNGRTSRALFYWYLLKNKYWFVEYIPISRIILKAPAKYKMAFIYSEQDDNDLTYFLSFHLRAFHLSIDDFRKYVGRKQRELKEMGKLLKRLPTFNYRQQELINHAIHHPDKYYTIRRHMSTHNIVYQTARVDLLELYNKGLFIMEKRGRTYIFSPDKELSEKIRNWKE